MSLEDEIVKSRKKRTMMQMVAADKLAAKKKIEARRARAKLLKEQSRKQDRQIPNRMTKAEREYMKTYGFSPSKIPAKDSDNKKVIKDKVTIKKSDATNTNLKKKKLIEAKNKRDENIKKAVFLASNENKNINKVKAGDTEKNNKSKSSKDDYNKYSSIAAAKAAGSLYYSKNGKKMAAVFAEDLKGLKGSAQEKLRQYLNSRTKKMSAGGALKAPDASNTGLKKLPTSVRNKMGYMNKGGTPKKANKGMLIITIGSGKKMKKKKKA